MKSLLSNSCSDVHELCGQVSSRSGLEWRLSTSFQCSFYIVLWLPKFVVRNSREATDELLCLNRCNRIFRLFKAWHCPLFHSLQSTENVLLAQTLGLSLRSLFNTTTHKATVATIPPGQEADLRMLAEGLYFLFISSFQWWLFWHTQKQRDGSSC